MLLPLVGKEVLGVLGMVLESCGKGGRDVIVERWGFVDLCEYLEGRAELYASPMV